MLPTQPHIDLHNDIETNEMNNNNNNNNNNYNNNSNNNNNNNNNIIIRLAIHPLVKHCFKCFILMMGTDDGYR